MKIVTHLDPGVLERELVERVEQAHPPGGTDRTLVLVPTTRLAEHVQRRLLERRTAWLGLHVQPWPGLGRHLLERTAGRAPHVAHPLLLQALLRPLLREQPDNPWTRFVDRRPGAAARLFETLNDLREAGVEPADLASCAGDDARTSALAALYARYHETLERRADEGWTDTAGLARAARPHAAEFGRGLAAVLVHGAYEILGIYLDLIRELDRTTPVTMLVPVAEGTRVSRYSERFARSFLLAPGDAFDIPAAGDDDDRARRLAALYDEQGRWESAHPVVFNFRHAQGAAGEVKYAVREALCAVRDGCPPTEIAIAARSLAPYAAALEEAFDDAGLPWTSSLGSPLRRHPLVREFLLLLRTAADRFPRAATLELMQAAHIDWPRLGIEPAPDVACADRWSRQAQVIDDVAEWTTALESWAGRPRHRPEQSAKELRVAEEQAERRAARARRIGDTVRRLDEAVPRDDASWCRHAESLSRLLADCFRGEDAPTAAALRQVLEVMGDLEQRVGDRRAIPFERMLAWLDDAVNSSRLTVRGEDDGGIRVLDAMQLRGSTFRHVHLLGMNSGVFPRAPREDPVLPDPVRRAVRERCGRPLGIEAESAEEEHLLLALIVGAARERLDVSWQRADESGRAKVASLALRELARISRGSADLEALRRDARHLPSHPEQWLEGLLAGTGLLTSDEEMLLAALHSRSADSATRLALRYPGLAPGLEALRETQSFTPLGNAYDSRVGPLERGKSFSVSELESLGRCPQQFFFGSILGVRTLDDGASLFQLASNELGTHIHELLERIYGTLRDESRFAKGDSEELVRRGLELAQASRGEIFGELGARLVRRLPGLWERMADVWFETVRRFVADDLRRIADAGLRPGRFEERVSAALDFGQEFVVEVRGRFDRRFEGDGGEIVGDYKVSTALSRRVDPTAMLKAHTLQVPLYQMMAGGDATVELLGIHPDLDPAEGANLETFSGFGDDTCLQSFRETMRVLLQLFREGCYPFQEGRHCEWCDFQAACRRNHPPTVERETQRQDAAGFRRIQRKSRRKPDGR